MKSSIHLFYGIIIGILVCACTGSIKEDKAEFKEEKIGGYDQLPDLEELKKDGWTIIDWEINQDHEIHQHIKVGNRVFHQKFGYGKITKIDGEKAEVNFEKTSTKNIFIKYLNLTY